MGRGLPKLSMRSGFGKGFDSTLDNLPELILCLQNVVQVQAVVVAVQLELVSTVDVTRRKKEVNIP